MIGPSSRFLLLGAALACALLGCRTQRGGLPARGELTYYVTDGFEERDGEVLEAIRDGIDLARGRLPGDHGTVKVLVLGPHRESAERIVREVMGPDADSPDGGAPLIEGAMKQEGNYFLSGDLGSDDPSLWLVFVGPQTHGRDNPRAISQIAAHEYTHVYQMSFRPSGPPTGEDAAEGLGPAWLTEGLADYLSWVWTCEAGWMGSRSGFADLRMEMDRRMQGIQEFFRSHSDTALQDSEGRPRHEVGEEIGMQNETVLLYWTGSWAVAWLVDQVGLEAVVLDLYEDMGELGWEGTFARHCDMSVEEFHGRFREFVAQTSREEQLAILPAGGDR